MYWPFTLVNVRHGPRESRHHSVKVSPQISLSKSKIHILSTSSAKRMNLRVVSGFRRTTQTGIQRAKLFSFAATHEAFSRTALDFFVSERRDFTDDVLWEGKVVKVVVSYKNPVKSVTLINSSPKPHSFPPRASLTVLWFHNHNLSF